MTPPNPELMHSLGRLVRGLSALFWGLPVALLACFYTYKAEPLKMFGGIVPPLASTGLLVFGIFQLTAFQKQERVWQLALERAQLLSFVLFGLSPFLYWSYRVPEQPFFSIMVLAMAFGGLLFLSSVNQVLHRLGAMLPDEALRHETSQFTSLNLVLLFGTLVLGILFLVLLQVPVVPRWLAITLAALDRINGGFWFLVLLVLLPLAMTMAMIWKTKEVILESVFGPEPEQTP